MAYKNQVLVWLRVPGFLLGRYVQREESKNLQAQLIKQFAPNRQTAQTAHLSFGVSVSQIVLNRV